MESHLKHIKDFPYNGQTISWYSDHNRVAHLKAEGAQAMAYGLGRIHAKERGFQILLLQAVIRGKLSSWIKESPETIETDRFIHKLGFYYQARKEKAELKAEEKEFLQSYIEGLNEGRRKYIPFEAKLLKIPFHPWKISDSLALIKIMTYFGLAQTQQDFEKFICLSLSKGISPQYFKSLFPKFPQTGIEEILPKLQKVNFDLSPIPVNQFTAQLPTLKASNNWALSPEKTETNSVLFACDPHLEVNRLPALWFEACWTQRDNHVIGITLPGLPGFLMGRNKDVGFSFTYGYMDCIDYFIEEVVDTKAKEEMGWSGISLRKEPLPLENQPDHEVRIYETERGVLEVPEDCHLANGKIKDGFYLSRAWTSHNKGSQEALETLRNLPFVSNTDQACEIVKKVYFSANWIFADSQGNIAYQQSGRIPKRKREGLYPLLASKKSHQWGFYNVQEYGDLLLHIKNPETKFLATANHDVQEDDQVLKVNLPMADYRFERITSKLKEDKKFSLLEMKSLQSDLYSMQAEHFLKLILDYIPETPSGRVLKEWDKEYSPSSKGAFLFEMFLKTTYRNIFGKIFDSKTWDLITHETTIVADFYGVFDRVLLKPSIEDLCWYPQLNNDTKLKEENSEEDLLKLILEQRNLCLEDSLKETLRNYPIAKLKTWGESNSFFFNHLLFGEELPSWLPWNKGPYALPGCRATVCQGNLYRDRGRQSSYAPSYRLVTDLSLSAVYTVIPGGPSDRFYKKSYANDISNWLNFNYKTVLPH